MALAFILVKVEAGKDIEVLEEIRASIYYSSAIERACATYGLYDLFIEANFGKEKEREDFIFNTLRKISGVKETVTIIPVSSVV